MQNMQTQHWEAFMLQKKWSAQSTEPLSIFYHKFTMSDVCSKRRQVWYLEFNICKSNVKAETKLRCQISLFAVDLPSLVMNWCQPVAIMCCPKTLILISMFSTVQIRDCADSPKSLVAMGISCQQTFSGTVGILAHFTYCTVCKLKTGENIGRKKSNTMARSEQVMGVIFTQQRCPAVIFAAADVSLHSNVYTWKLHVRCVLLFSFAVWFQSLHDVKRMRWCCFRPIRKQWDFKEAS